VSSVSLRRLIGWMFACLVCAALGVGVDRWTLSGRLLVERNPDDTLYYFLQDVPPKPDEEDAADRCLADYFSTGNRAQLEKANAHYKKIVPYAVGASWPALAWMSEYLLLAPDRRAPFGESAPELEALVAFHQRLKFSMLASTLGVQGFDDATSQKEPTLPIVSRFTNETLHFLDPQRESWERTTELIDRLELKAGDHVADIGCGPGYHVFRMAKRVGPTGRVHAVETSAAALAFVRFIVERQRVANVDLVKTGPSDITLPAASLDCALICSLYHAIYGSTSRAVREFFLGSVYRALKPGGRLVIVDNAPDGTADFRYFGNRIASRLVVSSVECYGFRCVRVINLAPQRYMVIFEKPR